jgi:hypothetical protein
MNDNKTNLEVLNLITNQDISPDRVLLNCVGKMKNAVVIGWDKDNDFYFASSQADGGDILWLMELAKKKLLGV